jgi:response regulator RpfG family c-di-GMP phosphodiesterase
MVPVGTGAMHRALTLLSGTGDALAARPAGFGRRRADLAARFAHHRGCDEAAVAASWIAGALADLGRLHVDVPADAAERRRLQGDTDAPLHGARLVAALGLPLHAADIVRWHREHDDGTGVPDRLRWDAIPADAAALGIVAAFLEALEDPAEPRPPEEALFALGGESGRRFSVELVRAFRGFITMTLGRDEAPLVPALPELDDALVRTLVASLDAGDQRPAVVALRAAYA